MQPLTPKTPDDLARYIGQHGIAAELVFPSLETPTVALAAQAMACLPEQIVKSVLFLIKGEAALEAGLVVANGLQPIDFRKLADVFQVGRKRIRLASGDEVLRLTGYAAGGVPPFGFDQPLPTFVHREVQEWPVVFGGGGDDRTLMRISPDELLRAAAARLIDAR